MSNTRLKVLEPPSPTRNGGAPADDLPDDLADAIADTLAAYMRASGPATEKELVVVADVEQRYRTFSALRDGLRAGVYRVTAPANGGEPMIELASGTR